MLLCWEVCVCGGGWRCAVTEASRYLLVKENKTFNEAQVHCTLLNMHTVVILNQEEQMQVGAYVDSAFRQ